MWRTSATLFKRPARRALLQPTRAYAEQPKDSSSNNKSGGFFSRLLFGERGAQAESEPEAAPKKKEQLSEAAEAAAASATAKTSATMSEKERAAMLDTDLEQLGREALKESGNSAEDMMQALRHRGAFTLNEFLTMLRAMPKSMRAADTTDAMKVLEAMSEAQRKANLLLNPAMLAALGPQLAKKAGVAADVPAKLVTQFQTVEAVQEAIRKWQERGEPIPTTMREIQEKAMRDGSFNHILGKLRASAKR